MTAHEAISVIRAEIERLKERAAAERVLHPKTILAAKNYLLIKDYDNLLSFLDTLEAEEQPKRTIHFMAGLKGNMPLGTRTMWYEAFKEIELEKYVNERVEEIFPQQDNDFLSQEDLRKVIRKTAEHFLDRGCRRTAVMYDDIEFVRQMEEEALPKFKGWVARDYDGDLFLYERKPGRRNSEYHQYREWAGAYSKQLDASLFPEIKWEDDPIEVELIINHKNSK